MLLIVVSCYFFYILGERLTDEEASDLLQGHEDAQGYINYEGRFRDESWTAISKMIQVMLCMAKWFHLLKIFSRNIVKYG